MLHYREFPTKIALTFVLIAAPLAYNLYIVTQLLTGTLFSMSLLEHHGLLGYGALAAVVTLPLVGLIADRIRRHDYFIILGSLITPILAVLQFLAPTLIPQFEFVFSLLAFGCLAGMAVFWALRANQSIVARYRGRTSAVFLLLSLVFLGFYESAGPLGLSITTNGLLLPAIISIVFVLMSAIAKPWNFPKAPLGVAGSPKTYFIPIVFVLAAHMLWYFVTKLNLASFFAGEPSYVTLSQFLNLGVLEMVPLGIGVVAAGFIADLRGRKTAFSFMVLMLGLLTIFGSALYTTYFDATDSSYTLWIELLYTLIISERFLEGFMLGLCLFLIWPELGSFKSKGLRLSLTWFFFLGYMALFWALDLNATVFGYTFNVPTWLPNIGGQVAILSSLIALYLIGPLPQILGREIEMEELALDFDEKQVKKTVDAFVGEDDFASIKSQIDILEATEVSDGDLSEILGDAGEHRLSLRRIPGVGTALEKKLRRAGYRSAVQLAGETAQRLAEKVDGITVARAEKILADARKLVSATIKEGK